jgi:AcrR family transcriptional regulator
MATRLTREQSKAQTRRRLLEAGGIVFARSGFGGASIRHIADEAGLTTGAVYAHFSSKEDLFLELLSQRAHDKVDALRTIATSNDTPAQQLQAMGDRYDSLHQHEGDWDLLATEFWLYAVRNPQLRDRLAQGHDILRAGAAATLQHNLSIDRRTAKEIATVLIAIGDGLNEQARISPKAIPPGMFARASQAVITGYLSRTPAKSQP